MSIHTHAVWAAAIVLLLSGGTASAQGPVNPQRVWAAVGVGAGMPASGGDGIANIIQLVYQSRSHHVAVRGSVLHDLDRNTDEIGELGMLYGRTRPAERFRVTLAAGLAAVALDRCPDDDDTCFTIGVPVLAELAVSRKFAGVGVQAFGNINSRASYAGAAAFVQLGRLR